MSKPNKRHHEKCKKYRSQGRREINKEKRRLRHEKRMQKFAERRENGKAYVYKPNPYDTGDDLWVHTIQKNLNEMTYFRNYVKRMCEFQRWARIFGRLENSLKQAKEQERMEEIKKRKTKAKGKIKKGYKPDES